MYGYRKSDQTHQKGTRIVPILNNGPNFDHGPNFGPHSMLWMLLLFSTGRIVYDPILLNRSNQLFRHLILQDLHTGRDLNLLVLVSSTEDVVIHLIFLSRSNLLFKQLKV